MKIIKIVLLFLLTSFLSLLIYVYFPYFKNLNSYYVRQKEDQEVEIMRQKDAQNIISQDSDVYERMLEDRQILVPVSEEFGMVIPKIKANAKIIAETDFMHSESYMPALTRGVAHAMWSGYPDELSTTVLFAHADGSFHQTARLNNKFLLLNKLEEGDDILIYYKGKEIKYKVKKKEKIKPVHMRYFDMQNEEDLIEISTRWPLSLNWRRLLITAQKVD